MKIYTYARVCMRIVAAGQSRELSEFKQTTGRLRRDVSGSRKWPFSLVFFFHLSLSLLPFPCSFSISPFFHLLHIFCNSSSSPEMTHESVKESLGENNTRDLPLASLGEQSRPLAHSFYSFISFWQLVFSYLVSEFLFLICFSTLAIN